MSEQVLNGTWAQLGYTVPFTLVHAVKYRTEDKLETQTILKLNTTLKNKQCKTQQNTTRLVQSPFTTLSQQQGGLILQCSRAHTGPNSVYNEWIVITSRCQKLCTGIRSLSAFCCYTDIHTCTRTLLQSPALTSDFATQRAAYAADRSTFEKSLPENAPPPCAPQPPYVSTMILRPVNPASPWKQHPMSMNYCRTSDVHMHLFRTNATMNIWKQMLTFTEMTTEICRLPGTTPTEMVLLCSFTAGCLCLQRHRNQTYQYWNLLIPMFNQMKQLYYLCGEWVSSVLRPLQHSIGYMGDGFLPVKKTQPTVSKYWRDTYSTSITEKHNNRTINTKHNKSPSLQQYGVTRGWLPQRAGLPGLNGGGAAAAVPPCVVWNRENLTRPNISTTTSHK